MPYFQRVQVMGVTGQAPEFKALDNGPLTRFSVCVEEWYRDSVGGKKKITTWFRCSAFNKLAEQAAKALKNPGTWVFVEGRLRTRKVEEREFWSITVDSFRILGPRTHEEQPDQDQPE